MFHATEVKTRAAVLIPDKIDFKTKTSKRQGWTLPNGINPGGDRAAVSVSTPNLGASKRA